MTSRSRRPIAPPSDLESEEANSKSEAEETGSKKSKKDSESEDVSGIESVDSGDIFFRDASGKPRGMFTGQSGTSMDLGGVDKSTLRRNLGIDSQLSSDVTPGVTPHAKPAIPFEDSESDEEVVDPNEFEALSQATVRCEWIHLNLKLLVRRL